MVEGLEYKVVHQDLLGDLLLLSTSTYSQVHVTTHTHTTQIVTTSVEPPQYNWIITACFTTHNTVFLDHCVPTITQKK